MRQFLVEQSQEKQLLALAKAFDYGLDDEDDREEAIETTVAVLRVHEQARVSVWEVGRLLSAQKERLEHGTFGRWLTDVLHWDIRYSQLYMQVHARWPDKDAYLSSGIGLLDFSKQSLLAAETTPVAAAERVVEIVQGKVMPSVREIKTIIREEKRKEATPLPVEATCDLLRKYARSQALDFRAERVERVGADVLQTIAPRGTAVVDDVLSDAKALVLAELAAAQPVVAVVAEPVRVAVRYVPADDVERMITQRVTLKACQWERLAALGDGDIQKGLERLLSRFEESHA